MTTLTDVQNALTTLQSAIATLSTNVAAISTAPTGAVAVQKSAVAGALGLHGLNPIVTLSAVADPTDVVRVSGSITVAEQYVASYNCAALYSFAYGFTPAYATVNRVYPLDAVGAVSADGVTVVLPAIPTTMMSASMGQYPGSAGVLAHAPVPPTATVAGPTYAPTLSFVSGTISLLTRYH